MIEKHAVEFQPDEYELRFKELEEKLNKKATHNSGYQNPYGSGYMTGVNKGYAGYGGGYPRSYDYDDDECLYPYTRQYYEDKEKEDNPSKEEKTINTIQNNNKVETGQGTLFNDAEIFDKEFVETALRTPIIGYKVKELLLMILTGCPVIDLWVKTSEINNKLFRKIISAFDKFHIVNYDNFIKSNLEFFFTCGEEPESYFTKYWLEQEEPSAHNCEQIIIVRLIEMLDDVKTTTNAEELLKQTALNALIEFYTI